MRRQLPIDEALLRVAGAVAVCAVTLWAVVVAEPAKGANPTGAKADGLEVVGGVEARTAPLQICPKGVGDAEPAHTCTKTSGRPYLGGKLTVLIQNNDRETSKKIKVRYVPRGGTKPIVLPGGSDRIFLVVDGTSPSNFLHSLLRKAAGQLPGSLKRRLRQVLPLLAQLAVGRFRFAAAVAKSPRAVALIAAALRAGGKLTPAQLRALALLSKGLLTVKPGKALSLTLGFAPPLSEAASSIDGRLLISAEGEKPLAVPVSGEARSFEEVTVTPSMLVFDSTEDEAKLTMEGAELVEYLRSYGGEELPVTLHDDGGETATATLALPSPPAEDEDRASGADREEDRVNRAKATVTLSGDPAAGKYTGKLTLPGLPAEAGAVSLELNESRSFICAALIFLLMMLVVFAGIYITGISTRIVTMATRRTRLTDVLAQTHKPFVHVVRRSEKQDDKKPKIASWRLDDLLGEDPAEDREPAPPAGKLQGLPALEQSISTARSSADLDEDAARVLDMVARMQRWLRVEPLARRLALLEAKVGPAGELPEERKNGKDGKDEPIDALAWNDSNTLRDTRALLAMARREPAEAKAADDLVARLLFQVEWHSRMSAAWDAAWNAKEDARRPKEVRALEEALGSESKVAKRDTGEQDGLTARLAGLLAKHDDIEVEEIGEIDGEEIDEQGSTLGITPVKWDASAHLFTGWATLDGQSYGQLARRTATSSRERYLPDRNAIKGELRFHDADWAWTFAILAFASAAYGVTVYNDTWGSCQDLATAFLAGSLGKVTIDWAALPIFQSVRLRKAAKSD